MKREWKPGDVALVEGEVMLRRSDGQWEHGDELRFPVTADDARPLVVIDPEDREQMARLLSSLEGMRFSAHACGAATCLQIALRALLERPKPEEPMGLGAVVEDDEGVRWIRTAEDPEDNLGKPWQSGPMHRHWEIVDAVRVLSDGWSGDE